MDTTQIATTLVVGLMLALIPAYFTHKMHERRSDKEAVEREQVREDERQERDDERNAGERQRRYEAKLAALTAFIEAAAYFKASALAHSGSTRREFVDAYARIEAARYILTVHFPPSIQTYALEVTIAAAKYGRRDEDKTQVIETRADIENAMFDFLEQVETYIKNDS